MSTENIVSIIPQSDGVYVEFSVHGAEGSRVYLYDLVAGAAILSGSDPADFIGTRVDSAPGGIGYSGGGVFSGLGGGIGEESTDAVIGIGELGELL